MNKAIDQLKKIPTFAEVPLDQLKWLSDHSDVVDYSVDDYIFEKKDPIDKMYIVLEGEIEIKLEQSGRYKVVARISTNEITGFLPYSRATSSIGYGQCSRACKIMEFPKERMRQLATEHYELTESLVHQMTSRTRELATSNLQNEKLMALGKLSAGLAHELNNPASAMIRNAIELKNQLGQVPEKFQRLMKMRATEHEVTAINDILFSRISNQTTKSLSLIERSEIEDDLEDYMSDHGIDGAYKLTESLVDFGFTISDLEIIQKVTKSNFSSAVEWIENVLTTERLVVEINESATRISDLVASIKSYSHMDKSHEKQKGDIAIGIRNTLTMLNHKIKSKQITVSVDIAENLIHPKVIMGEINQVWTNIIDNAIDAVSDQGTITIEGFNNKESVIITILDNGPGIAPENLSKIYDPFFTTKEIGKGTGLGLDVSYRIIKQHNGNIKVNSSKNGTIFEIELPQN